MNNDIKAVLNSKEQIDEVARNLGERITKDFEGKNPLVICVLKGAVLFMADIVRQIDTYCELDFMDVSSYGQYRFFRRSQNHQGSGRFRQGKKRFDS